MPYKTFNKNQFHYDNGYMVDNQTGKTYTQSATNGQDVVVLGIPKMPITNDATFVKRPDVISNIDRGEIAAKLNTARKEHRQQVGACKNTTWKKCSKGVNTKHSNRKKIERRKIMDKQQHREALEKALSSMNLENYQDFALIFSQNIRYLDLNKLIVDYFNSLQNSKEYTTLVWDMVELSKQY